MACMQVVRAKRAENFAIFKSSLANVKSHYLFSVLQNDIHCILGSEKGGGAPGPPLNLPLMDNYGNYVGILSRDLEKNKNQRLKKDWDRYF